MRIKVRVQPRASKKQILKIKDGSLKVYLTEAPQKGKANEALVELIAGYYNVRKSCIRIVTGGLSRDKIIDIGG